MWTGNCRIWMEGKDKCKIELVNEDGTLFAASAFKDLNYDKYVQRCVDSSRFFALVLVNENTSQKAMVGVHFPERNDSFDFIQAMNDYVKHSKIANGTDDSQKSLFSSSTAQDFSLKQGEKMTLNIKGVSNESGAAPKKGFGGGLKKLAPPPSQALGAPSSGSLFGAVSQP
mmetsp:Transcript_21740/g.33557  ORF Transcript_21740/g.33557 Transcript_21740/m.33557 type:complete len:171 (+) Transcript_21740:112-624(+)